MSRLLCAGFSRLKKSKCFWGCMIFMFLYAAFMRYSQYMEGKSWGYLFSVDDGFFSYTALIGILLSAFISLYIGTEYSDGTIRNKLVIGHTRTSIYLSNLIVCLTAGLLICLSFLCASLLTGIALLEPFQGSARDIVILTLTSFMMAFSFTALLTLTAMICQNRAITAVINILSVFFLLMASLMISSYLNQPEMYEAYSYIDESGELINVEAEPNPNYPRGATREVYEFLNDFLPSGQVMQFNMSTPEDPGLLCLCSGTILLVSTGLGIYIFKKKNIK